MECLNDCECLEVPYLLIEGLMASEEEVRRCVSDLFLQEVTRLEGRTRTLLLFSATERYEEFKAQYPGLEERIPLKYIASYIGIRPGSLSRIRKTKESI